MLLLIASANRDEPRYLDGDRFDVHREFRLGLTFGRGIHYRLGPRSPAWRGVSSWEDLKSFPEWDVDTDAARLTPTSTVRGWNPCPYVPEG